MVNNLGKEYIFVKLMIKDNTSTNAYDSFGQELYKDDQVLCSSIECGRIMLYKGKVIDWTKKRVKIEITAAEDNTDWKGSSDYLEGRIGEVIEFKPDKIYKI